MVAKREIPINSEKKRVFKKRAFDLKAGLPDKTGQTPLRNRGISLGVSYHESAKSINQVLPIGATNQARLYQSELSWSLLISTA